VLSRKPYLAIWLLVLLLHVPLTAADSIHRGIWRLDGITPGRPSSDHDPLRKKIGKATVVAMGESIYGSGGFLTARHQIFRDLVERAGFRAIALETPWSAADGLGAYVKSCSGSPEEALPRLRDPAPVDTPAFVRPQEKALRVRPTRGSHFQSREGAESQVEYNEIKVTFSLKEPQPCPTACPWVPIATSA
jgi:hypothetical protein